MTSFKFRTKWEGVDRLTVKYREGRLAVDDLTEGLKRRLSHEAQEAFRQAAPKKTGRLARGIRARIGQDGFTISMTATNNGYNYGGVTRFGHRTAFIEPKDPRRMLRLQFMGGKTIYRARVRGFHPATDWAGQARVELRSALRRESVLLGRRVARKMS